jgi:large subunit ribosomal protein L17
MRHRKEKRQLGRTASHRSALLRNLVTSLIDKERIETTLAKAKELRRVADRMVTLGKKGDLASRRRALRVVRSRQVVKKLFSDIALRFEGRQGGYTRIYQIGPRPGDGASMALIELVDRPQKEGGSTDKKAGKDSSGKKKAAPRKK